MEPLTAAIIGSTVLGGGLGVMGAQASAKSQSDLADKNIALQREFATHGLRWKV